MAYKGIPTAPVGHRELISLQRCCLGAKWIGGTRIVSLPMLLYVCKVIRNQGQHQDSHITQKFIGSVFRQL